MSDLNMSLLSIVHTIFWQLKLLPLSHNEERPVKLVFPTTAYQPKDFSVTFSSCPTNLSAMNSDSMVERAIQVCLEDFHEIAPAPKVNT